MAPAVKVTGVKELSTKLRNVRARYLTRTKRKTEMWAGKLRDAIRTGKFFDKPTPNLQQRVWAGKAVLSNDTVTAQAGWGSDYGPILEWGVSEATQAAGGWKIKAKTPNGLFFKGKGDSVMTGIMEVWHPWNYGDKGSRPHWSVVMATMGPKIEKDLAATIPEIFKRGR